MEINLFIGDQCPICFDNYDKRCISLSLRKPIILHKNVATGVVHEICEKCLLDLMAAEPLIECPHCQNFLSLREENQLPKKILKCKHAIFSHGGLAFRSVVHLANFIMPFYETCTMGINLYTTMFFGIVLYLEFTKGTSILNTTTLLYMWCLLLAEVNLLFLPLKSDDCRDVRGEKYKCCDYIGNFAIERLFIIPFVMGIMFFIEKLLCRGCTSFLLGTVFNFLCLTKIIISGLFFQL